MNKTFLSAFLLAAFWAAPGTAVWAAKGIRARGDSSSHDGNGDGDRQGASSSPSAPSPSRSSGLRPAAGYSRFPAPGSPAIIRNPRVAGHIHSHRAGEISPGRSYWHTVGGVRYAHRFDHGLHWYGFYRGPRFYWTALYGDRWWWYDPAFSRWVFWSEGYWWWGGPGGAIYVNVDGDYRPYEESGVNASQVPAAAGPPPSADVPAEPAPGAGSWKSPDGRRMVQVTSLFEAVLYDMAGTSPSFLKHLGGNVQSVRFSGGTDGKPLRILVDRRDGAFDLYAEDGSLITNAGPPAGPPPAPAQ